MMTGDEYRKSLDDGRLTYFEGKRILELPNHPILGITVDSAASGYDRFYKSEKDAIGEFMKVPGSAAELRERGCRKTNFLTNVQKSLFLIC